MSLQAAASVIASGVANMLLPYKQIEPRTSPPASIATRLLMSGNQLCIPVLENVVQFFESPAAQEGRRCGLLTRRFTQLQFTVWLRHNYVFIHSNQNRSVSGSNSRPRTPPSASNSRDSSAAPSRNATSPRPSRPTYSSFLRNTDHDWDQDEGDEGDMFEDDEDEFGLPSIANMRRKGRRKQPSGSNDLGGSRTVSGSSAWRGIDSGDIAEERGIPTYPTAKKVEGKILRPQYQEILRDPANSLHLISHASIPANATAKQIEEQSSRTARINKFKRILQASTVSLSDLRDLAWSGVPTEVRAMTWQVLLGYLPTSSERRVATLERKRKEYLEGVRQAFDKGTSGSTSAVSAGMAGVSSFPSTVRGRGRGLDEAVWHQISIDVPRTNPHLPLYQYEATQRSLERILYVWAIRHPASGYVQGINDLVTPFWQVFLGSYISDPDIEFGMDPGQLPKQVLDAVEADSFWCLTKLLDGIQDNYIAHQPGIQRQVADLRDLTTRIDGDLATHLQNEGVEFIQFSFRWMNCLLMREISVKNTVRMWDTYLVCCLPSLRTCLLTLHRQKKMVSPLFISTSVPLSS